MISIAFNLRNPFSDRFEILTNPSWRLGRHEQLEFQINRTSDIVGLHFRITVGQNHSGIFFSLALLGFEAIIDFYDTRHWDER